MFKMSNKPTNEEKLLTFIFQNGGSFSEREGVFNLNFTSGRNYINKLERKLQIEFKREWEKTSDGENKYYRYTIPNKQTAEKLINYANTKANFSDFSKIALNRFLISFNE